MLPTILYNQLHWIIFVCAWLDLFKSSFTFFFFLLLFCLVCQSCKYQQHVSLIQSHQRFSFRAQNVLDSPSIHSLPHLPSLSLSLRSTLSFLGRKNKAREVKKIRKQEISSGLFGEACSEIMCSMERTSFHYLN